MTEPKGTTTWQCQFASFNCPSKLKLSTKRDQHGVLRHVVLATGHHEHDTPDITHESHQIIIRDTIRKVVVDNWRPKTKMKKRGVFDEAAALLVENPAWLKDEQPGHGVFYDDTMKHIESSKGHASRLNKRNPFATESTRTVTAEQSAAIRSEVTKCVAENQRTSDGAGDACILEVPGAVFGVHGLDDTFAMQVHLVCRSQLAEVLDYTGRQHQMGILGLCVNVDHTQAGLDLKEQHLRGDHHFATPVIQSERGPRAGPEPVCTQGTVTRRLSSLVAPFVCHARVLLLATPTTTLFAVQCLAPASR